MAIKVMTRGVSSGSGYQPPPKKKSRTLNCEANRGESYKSSTQPGRVPLSQISWHPSNRGGQGILPMHAHVVAKSICAQGTSIRRYNSVRLVEVPEAEKDAWLKGVERKINLNSQLSRFQAISHSGRMYATLTCSHFVEAHKLIHEGQRHYMDEKDKQRLELRDDDEEGRQIQERGVSAIVYGQDLWADTSAILSIMREDNLDAEVQKEESELDAFGLAHTVVKELIGGYQPHNKSITVSSTVLCTSCAQWAWEA